ncbi:MAG TPA: ABC transporter permease, partial [bacterium]|nr:ABC transporter permease [bacterium]
MSRILLLALREYKAQVKTKGFIIGIIIAPFLMGGGMLAWLLLAGHVDTSDKRIAVVDRTGLVEEVLVRAAEERNEQVVFDEETGKKVRPAFLIEVIEPDDVGPTGQRLSLSNRVREKQLYAFLEIGSGALHPRQNPESGYIRYYSENPAMDEDRYWFSNPVNGTLRQHRMIEAGIEESQVPDLFIWMDVEGMELVTVDEKTGEISDARRGSELATFLVPFGMIMLMFLMIMMGASPQLFAVMEEKSQRIAEVILGSVKPFQFMFGKLLGGVAVSLTVAAVYVIGGVLTVQNMGFTDRIPYHVLPWLFAYIILAVLMFGSGAAALGSACNDASDAQNLNLPAILPALIPLFLIGPVLQQPNSAIATWLSLVPPFTPILMFMRQSMPGGVPEWQPIVGLAGVILFTVFSIW